MADLVHYLSRNDLKLIGVHICRVIMTLCTSNWMYVDQRGREKRHSFVILVVLKFRIKWLHLSINFNSHLINMFNINCSKFNISDICQRHLNFSMKQGLVFGDGVMVAMSQLWCQDYNRLFLHVVQPFHQLLIGCIIVRNLKLILFLLRNQIKNIVSLFSCRFSIY